MRKAPRLSPLTLWTRRFLVLLVAANYLLVLFDLTYIPWRNFWLHNDFHVSKVKINLPFIPPITSIYDPIKGIDSHRETEAYLEKAAQLQALLLDDRRAVKQLEPQLEQLRELSRAMINEDPFAAVGKSGTLVRIKRQMRDHVGLGKDASAKQAFEKFWSQDNLTIVRQKAELSFFYDEIRPLIETNYYREIGENGQFIDRFWQLDLWFQLFFGLELLIYVIGIKRRYSSLSWREALLWRWYDLPLFLPFFRWLRFLPLMVRLQSSRLLNLEPIRSQASRGFVGIFASELLEVIAVQTINQLQQSVRRGDLKSVLRSVQDPYVDLNDTNEIEVLARRLSEILVYRVLPQIRPDVEALLQQNLLYTLERLPAYRALQNLPGFNLMPNRLTQQLASGVSQALTSVSQGTYDTLAVRDPAAAELTERLVQSFTVALSEALSDQNTLAEIQTLICDFLEEFKYNYVSRIADSDFEEVLEEAQQLQRRSGQA